MHVYTSQSPAVLKEYADLGCIMHTTVPERYLPAVLSQYTAGLQGFGAHTDYSSIASPNKAWVYLAAGIPTIGINAGSAGNIYNGRWCTVLDSVSDMRTVFLRIPEITDAMRYSETIDQEEGTFRMLMARALGMV